MAICLFAAGYICPTYSQGYDEYRKTIKNDLKLMPFVIPTATYGPGTILSIKKEGWLWLKKIAIENLYSTKDEVFPNAQITEPSPVPLTVITKIKSISFDIDLEKKKDNVPGELKNILGISFNNGMRYNFILQNAETIDIPELKLEEAIRSLNPKLDRDALILDKLMEENSVIVAKVLKVKGFSFNFANSTKLVTNVQVEIKKETDKLGFKYSFLDSNSFSISSDDTLFIAYSTYSKNAAEIRKMIKNKKAIDSLSNVLAEKKTTIQATDAKLNETNISDITLQTKENKAKIESIESLVKKSTSNADISKYNNELSKLRNQLEQLEGKVRDHNVTVQAKKALLAGQDKLDKELKRLLKIEYDVLGGVQELDSLGKIYETDVR